HPPEERLRGAVEAGEKAGLPHVAVEGGVLGEGGPQGLQLSFLLKARGAPALPPTPPREALLQGALVEQTAAPQHFLQPPLLGRRRLEVVLERLADGLHAGGVLLPSAAVCLLG